MSRFTKTRKIDGIDFSVTQLDGVRGMKMLNTLFRIFGPGLGRAIVSVSSASSAEKGLLDMEINPAAIGEALASLSQSMTNEELESITNELLETATYKLPMQDADMPLLPVEGELRSYLPQVTQGRPFTAFKLLAFALEANFASFFEGNGGVAGILSRAVAQAKETMTEKMKAVKT